LTAAKSQKQSTPQASSTPAGENSSGDRIPQMDPDAIGMEAVMEAIQMTMAAAESKLSPTPAAAIKPPSTQATASQPSSTPAAASKPSSIPVTAYKPPSTPLLYLSHLRPPA
jgi:hypothetical protein